MIGEMQRRNLGWRKTFLERMKRNEIKDKY